MSVRVMTAVWEIDLPASDKIVLLALADCANDEGKCWPGMTTLTQKCSKGERTIQASVKRLVAAGHLSRKEVLGRGCKYVVHPSKDCAPAENAPPQKLTKTPAKSAGKPSRTVNGCSNEQHERVKGWPEIPDWVPVAEWNGFVRMRKTIRKPLTDRAVTTIIRKLERFRANGHDPGAVLDTSTENSWAGIFEPRTTANDYRNSKPTGTANAAQRAIASLGG